ncbi:hypothetical protein ACFWFQ_27905 [Nocardia salmonicida]|uniref:hypothetical protein n=1 Tax=Nocardia salmonicida TaxID=53431 RepID=UPI00365C5509
MTIAAPAYEWGLPLGSASVYPVDRSRLRAPFILVGSSGSRENDTAALTAEVDHSEYSFRNALHEAGYDLILVHPLTSETLDGTAYSSLQQAILRTIAEKGDHHPLTICGIGRGALLTRHALAKLEITRVDHQVRNYLSYSSTEPTNSQTAELAEVGHWPILPRKVEIITTDDNYRWTPGEFDAAIIEAAPAGKPLFTRDLGTRIITQL